MVWKRSPKLNSVLEIGSLLLVFLFTVLLFLFINFPRKQLAQRIVSEIEDLTNGQVEIVSCSVSLFITLKADGAAYKVKGLSGEDVSFSIHNIRGSLSWLYLLLGKTVVTVTGLVKDEPLTVVAKSSNEKDWDVHVKGQNIPLASVNPLLDPVVSLGGGIDLLADITTEQNELSSGTINANLSNILLQNINYKEIEIPDINLDIAELALDIEENKVKIKDLVIRGDGIDITADGTIDIRRSFNRSLLNIGTAISITPGFLKDHELSMFSSFLINRNGGPVNIPIKGTIGKPKADISSIIKTP